VKTGQGKPTSRQQQHHLVTSLTLTACGEKPALRERLDGPVGKPAGTETGEATGQWPGPWPEPTEGKTGDRQQLGKPSAASPTCQRIQRNLCSLSQLGQSLH